MHIIKGSGPALPLTYSDELGWVLDVKEAMPASAVQSAARWAYNVNKERFKSLPVGPSRDRAMKALELLRQGKVRLRIKGTPEIDLFKSTKKVTDTLYFHG